MLLCFRASQWIPSGSMMLVLKLLKLGRLVIQAPEELQSSTRVTRGQHMSACIRAHCPMLFASTWLILWLVDLY